MPKGFVRRAKEPKHRHRHPGRPEGGRSEPTDTVTVGGASDTQDSREVDEQEITLDLQVHGALWLGVLLLYLLIWTRSAPDRWPGGTVWLDLKCTGGRAEATQYWVWFGIWQLYSTVMDRVPPNDTCVLRMAMCRESTWLAVQGLVDRDDEGRALLTVMDSEAEALRSWLPYQVSERSPADRVHLAWSNKGDRCLLRRGVRGNGLTTLGLDVQCRSLFDAAAAAAATREDGEEPDAAGQGTTGAGNIGRETDDEAWRRAVQSLVTWQPRGPAFLAYPQWTYAAHLDTLVVSDYWDCGVFWTMLRLLLLCCVATPAMAMSAVLQVANVDGQLGLGMDSPQSFKPLGHWILVCLRGSKTRGPRGKGTEAVRPMGASRTDTPNDSETSPPGEIPSRVARRLTLYNCYCVCLFGLWLLAASDAIFAVICMHHAPTYGMMTLLEHLHLMLNRAILGLCGFMALLSFRLSGHADRAGTLAVAHT